MESTLSLRSGDICRFDTLPVDSALLLRANKAFRLMLGRFLRDVVEDEGSVCVWVMVHSSPNGSVSEPSPEILDEVIGVESSAIIPYVYC